MFLDFWRKSENCTSNSIEEPSIQIMATGQYFDFESIGALKTPCFHLRLALSMQISLPHPALDGSIHSYFLLPNRSVMEANQRKSPPARDKESLKLMKHSDLSPSLPWS